MPLIHAVTTACDDYISQLDVSSFVKVFQRQYHTQKGLNRARCFKEILAICEEKDNGRELAQDLVNSYIQEEVLGETIAEIYTQARGHSLHNVPHYAKDYSKLLNGGNNHERSLRPMVKNTRKELLGNALLNEITQGMNTDEYVQERVLFKQLYIDIDRYKYKLSGNGVNITYCPDDKLGDYVKINSLNTLLWRATEYQKSVIAYIAHQGAVGSIINIANGLANYRYFYFNAGNPKGRGFEITFSDTDTIGIRIYFIMEADNIIRENLPEKFTYIKADVTLEITAENDCQCTIFDIEGR